MTAILKQRNFFVTKIFEITGNSIKASIKRPLNYVEDEFKFEELTTRLIRKKSFNRYMLIATFLFFLGLSITVYSYLFEKKDPSSLGDILFYAIPTAFLAGLAVLSKENAIKLILVDKRSLSFYANSPSNNEVAAFLDFLFSEQKKYLLNRYAKADPYTSTEQMISNLNWLRDRNTINDHELEELRNKLLPKPGSSSSVGFRFNPGSN